MTSEAPTAAFGEGGLATGHIVMDDAEATDVVERVYGVSGVLTRVATEKDDSFRVSVDGNPRYVVKIANPHDPPEELDFQLSLLRRVAEIDPSIPVPHVIPALDGSYAPVITDRAGQVREVWLITHMRGHLLDHIETEPHEREKIGEVLAKLRYATAGYSHPAQDHVLAWDVKHIMTMAPMLQHVTVPRQRELIAAGLERLAGMQSRIQALRTQVLHNDFSRSNLLGDHDDPEFLTGVIDFGDSVRTAIAIDVSTALVNQLPRDAAENPVDDLFAQGRDLLRGYLRLADLDREELWLLPHLTMARAVARALITIRRAELFPHNRTYILRNTEPGWAQLEWFMARSIDEISATFTD